MKDFVFNHDGFGALEHLAETPMTEADAVAMLVQPRRLGDPGESARPWDLFALAWIDRTQESADAMVEDLVHRAPPDVDDALILADCCDTIGMFPEG